MKFSSKFLSVLIATFGVGAHAAVPQTFQGDVIFNGNATLNKELSSRQASSSDTGNIDTLSTAGVYQLRLTGAGAVVRGFAGGREGKELLVINGTGGEITIVNDAGAPAANRILTGTGKDIEMKGSAAYRFTYDKASSRWLIAGGGGGGTEVLAVAPLTYNEETAELALPPATVSADGYMPKEAQTAIADNTTRIGAEEAATAAQATTNANLADADAALDTRVDAEEAATAAQATTNASINSKNDEQDGRLTAEESATAAQLALNAIQDQSNSIQASAITALQDRAATERTLVQTAHGLTVGNLVRHNGTGFVKALADSDANAEVAGIVVEALSPNEFRLVSEGYVTGLSGLTPGAVYRLSVTEAGAMQTATPSVVGQVDKPVFVATSATAGYLIQSRGILVSAPPFSNPQINAGDLIGTDGTSPVRVPVGNQGEVLTADPTAPSKLSYKKISGGSKNYVQNPSGDVNATTGITAANTTVVRSTTAPTLGDASELQVTIDSATDRVTFALDAFPERLKNVGLCNVTIPFKADANAETVRWEIWRAGGTVPSAQGAFYNPGGTNPGYAGGNFLCGDLAAATELRVQGTGTLASALRMGNVAVTEAQASKDNIGGSFVGSVKITGCAAQFIVNSQTPADFSQPAGCVYTVDGQGLAAPTGNFPGLALTPDDASAVYLLDFNSTFQTISDNAATAVLYDATNNAYSKEQNRFGSAAGYHLSPKVSANYYPRGTNTVQLRLRAYGDALRNINANGLNDPNSMTINVWKFPRSQAVFNVKNQSGDYDPTPYAPTFNGGAGFSNAFLMHERKGKFLRVTGQALTVAVNGNSAYFSIPSGLEIDFDALGAGVAPNNYNKIVGYITRGTGTTVPQVSIIAVPGTPNLLGLGITGSGSFNPLTPRNWNEVFGNGEPLSFKFEVPIKGWFKSNVSSNIAGEPGVYHGVQGATCGGTSNNTTTTPVDLPPSTACSVSQVDNTNFGTVTLSTTTLKADFTPKYTGKYFVCLSTAAQATTNQSGTVYLTDSSNVIVGRQSIYANNAGTVFPLNVCGVFDGVANAAKSLRVQASQSSGVMYVGNPSGAPNGASEWTIFPLTTNLKLDGSGGVGRSEAILWGDAGAGSTNTKNRNYSNAASTTPDLVAANNAATGATITVQPGGAGMYTVHWNGVRFPIDTAQITRNCTNYCSSPDIPGSSSTSGYLTIFDVPSANHFFGSSTTVWLNEGDVIRSAYFTANATHGSPSASYLKVTKVSK